MYRINLYIETSIRGVKSTVGWYGYLLEWIDSRGNPHTISDFGYELGVTPNQLVLKTFCRALDRLGKDAELTVFTDSLYLRNCYTQHLQNWKENNWKTAKGEKVKNLSLWQQVNEKTRRHVVAFNADHQHPHKNWMIAEIQRRKTL